MKTLLIILFSSLSFYSCKNKQQKTEVAKPAESKSIYTETAESKFEILSKQPRNAFVYKTVESNFKPVSIQLRDYDRHEYFANITTTTKKWTSVEGQERNIRIKIKAFDNPSKTVVEINKNCDDIDLQTTMYKTIKYGCCGNVNHYEIFNYENKEIIEGDDKIITGFIPDSDLEIYVGFTHETIDSTLLGTLYYTTYYPGNNPERFAIKIKSKLTNVKKCDIVWPKISLQTNKKIDKLYSSEIEYWLWSLDKVKNENLINNLTIRFSIECTEKQNFKFLNIPIVNGKPFGKNEKIQEMTLD
jgi:hypothetical protein